MTLQGKDGILYSNTIVRTNSFLWKDLKKALHSIFSEGESKHMLSRLAAQRICETKILQISKKNQGSMRCSQVRTWEEERRNSECGSDQRTSGIESYVWFRGLWRSVSQRRMPRETEKHKQKIFHSKPCWVQMQNDNGKGIKGGHKEGTQKQKVRKVHFVALMDIRHIQKYEYIPENVRESILKSGNYENVNWDNH